MTVSVSGEASSLVPADTSITVEGFKAVGAGNHHGWLGFDVTHVDTGIVEANMTIRDDHLNPARGLHGGVSASFADSLCGYGVFTTLPVGADGFTTIDLTASYLGRAALDDQLTGTARLTKGGRQIQLWDVTIECNGRPVAAVRVTQLILYPRT